jgi:hypothetical protein
LRKLDDPVSALGPLRNLDDPASAVHPWPSLDAPARGGRELCSSGELVKRAAWLAPCKFKCMRGPPSYRQQAFVKAFVVGTACGCQIPHLIATSLTSVFNMM